MPLISKFRKQRQRDLEELKVSLAYRVNSKQPRL